MTQADKEPQDVRYLRDTAGFAWTTERRGAILTYMLRLEKQKRGYIISLREESDERYVVSVETPDEQWLFVVYLDVPRAHALVVMLDLVNAAVAGNLPLTDNQAEDLDAWAALALHLCNLRSRQTA